jgi:UPF0716 family protein affecting phage T7 exclusion
VVIGAGGLDGSDGGDGTTYNIGNPTSEVVALDGGVSGLGGVAWLVPGLAMSLPGLLLFLILAIQVVFSGFFFPITRRLLGSSSRPRGKQPIT